MILHLVHSLVPLKYIVEHTY